MSADFVGSSGSNYGGSSSGNSGGSGSLTQTILGAVSLAGENILLNNNSPGLVTRPLSAPVLAPTAVKSLAPSSMSTWLIVIVLIVVGVFAFKKL